MPRENLSQKKFYSQSTHPHGVRLLISVRDKMSRPDFGSSPRVWGTFSGFILFLFIFRFIPTCVGNMKLSSLRVQGPPVHPHVCGEHIFLVVFICNCIGSSPRVWGTYNACILIFPRCRFIPTCVGNIILSVMFLLVLSVHPHVCGEH